MWRFTYDFTTLQDCNGTPFTVITTALTALIGTWLLSSGLGGYIRLGGKIDKVWLKALVIAAGFLMCWPEQYTDIIGLVLAIILVFVIRKMNEKKAEAA